MTKQNEKKVAEAIKADDIVENTSKIADTARDFVKRTAASAKERSDSLYEGSEKFNSGLEKVLTRAVSGYVGILGNIAEATHANVDHTLSTVEKLAGAKSMSEAAQIQADFVRDNASANVERARDALNTTRDVVAEGASAVRENVAKVWPLGQKAA